MNRTILLHACVVLALLALNWLLPAYHHGLFARIMVMAVFASGFALLFGYGGLLSLGHAMFFSLGLYAAGLSVDLWNWPTPLAFLFGILAGASGALLVGLLALRTTGTAFMIVTLMFAQVFFLAMLYWAEITRGEDGFTVNRAARSFTLGPFAFDPADPTTRYLAAWALFSAALFSVLALVRSRWGRVLVAVRENEERTGMLGYDTWALKLQAVVISGALAATAGAAYALLFGYVGASFASVQYSILPLLWSLLGGAATVLGPFLGTLLMHYAIDYAGTITQATLGVIGLLLVLLVLFFPKGILGTLRDRALRWLP